ncbi:MAG: hypothetical protein OQK75_14270 [Gammaproteobacteria bacterium]|nr:hypothetical protein [Gammaproteobacteria bacterium]MCW8988825.1 hypothetical protein [Gammaproteobacteria bacterium]MCW9032523.1 hypothetical protein [Gammaproteobacteria bacterium]
MNNKNIFQFLMVITLMIFNGPLSAEDRIELEGMSIIGNKELPKMLYIVPWKNSELPDMNAPPIESLIDEALAPVDRDNFKRRIRYFQIYSSKKDKQ